MHIRPSTPADGDAIWAILEPAIRAGETYALPRDWGRSQALDYWCGADREAFVAEADGAVLGSFFVRANQPGPGGHVANAGYATHPDAAGRGLATAMARASLDWARARSFRAMQFNFVVSTNARAVRLWQHLGFAIVGTLPGAFRHPALGDVDVYVMYQRIEATA